MLKSYPLHIMGAKTYEYFKPNPVQPTHIIVLTRHPEKYQAEAKIGQLDFIDLDIQTLLATYSRKYKSCLILGGSTIYSEFIDANLVDELYITVEPCVFESGTTLLTRNRSLEALNLPNPIIKKLNKQGTELRQYIFKHGL